MRQIFLIFLIPITSYSQTQIPYVVGERSLFNISFQGIKVGTGEIEIKNEKKIGGVSTFHIVGKGKTAPFFDLFFKVRDVYETHLDTSETRPVKFLRDVYEGGYEKKQQYKFEHSKQKVFYKDTSYTIFSQTQDMLSAVFFVRRLDKQKIKKEESFFVPIFMNEENYDLEIKYLYNENIETAFGTIDCMVLKPKMQEGRVFKNGEKMKVWISDDKNHLPIKVETEIWGGTIRAVLAKHQNTKHPLLIK